MVGQFSLKAMASTVLVASVVLSAVAANKTVTWSATDGLAPDDETVALALDANDRVTNLTVNAQDDVVTLSGTDALPFADGAEICLDNRNRSFVFDIPVEGAGTLAFKSRHPNFLYANETEFLPSSESGAVVVARNVNLDEYEPDTVVSRPASGPMTAYAWIDSVIYELLYVERGAGTYTCQAQVVHGGWSKCVKLCLKQVGNDIVAWTPQAWYASTENYGRDFTTFSANPQNVSCVATGTQGYGIYKLALKCLGGETTGAVLKKAVSGVSTLTVESNVGVTAEGDETLTTGSVWNTSLVLGGRFIVRNRGALELSGDVTYLAGGEMEMLADQEHADAPSTLTMRDYPDKNERITIGHGIFPSAITNVTATTCGGWFNDGKKMNAYQFHFTSNGLTCQLQHYDGTQYVKGIILAFELEGTNLVAYVVDAKYTTTSADQLGKVDFRTVGGSQPVYNNGQNGNEHGYGIKDIAIHLSDMPLGRLIGISGAHTGTSSRLQVTGSEHERIQVNILQSKKQAYFTVNTNAVLNFCPTSPGSGCFDLAAPLCVNPGGEFWQNGDWSVDANAQVCLSGGVFRVFHDTAPSTGVRNLYRNYTTFLDGGRMSDHGYRMGYYSDPVVTVRGTQPAYIEGGDLGIVGNDTVAKRTVTFDVDDVTGDEEPDLYAMGRMYYSNAGSGWTNAVIVKKGVGTILAGVNEATTYPLTVRNGTWKLGCSGATNLRNDLLLEGGAIACAAGCTNAFRTAELAAGTVGLVKLDEGAELSFAAFTPGEGSCLSVLTAQVSERLRIGTSACLTGPQLRIIRLDGERVHQDADGYLHPGAPGTMLLFR